MALDDKFPPPLPPVRGGGFPMPPLAPAFKITAASEAERAREREEKIESLKDEFENKLLDLEKKLRDEREKPLLTQSRGQEETATAAKAEISLKEFQDKLQRDRRDMENEETRLKLERRSSDLEARLVQERETWATELKSQLSSRETQDKEIETHFAARLQEMERRWLEEKAQWQKTALAKDDEIRTLRALADKLRGADAELAKAVSERKLLDERLAEVVRERGEALLRLQSAAEREKEAIQLRADLTLTRQQSALIQERLERDLAALRQSSHERSERLVSDSERLQRDLATVKQRLEAEHEADLRRARAEHDAGSVLYKDRAEKLALELQRLRAVAAALERQGAAARAQIEEMRRANVAREAEIARYKDLSEKSTVELQRLRAVAAALERQGTSSRVQLDEMRRATAGWEKTQERYKAEFMVLQRKWVEREKEVRAEATQASLQLVESEKMRLRVQAQDELNTRAAKIADQLRLENESEQKRLESRLRADLERELAERRQALIAESDTARTQSEMELGRLRRELQQKDASWGERLLAKESELITQRSRADEQSGRLSREEEGRTTALRDKATLEKQLESLREQLGSQQASLRAFQDRLAMADVDKARLESEKTDLERLSTAQAAQVHGVQEAIEGTRLQLARQTQTNKILQNAHEQSQKALAAQRMEMMRSLQAHRVEFDRVLRAEKDRADAAQSEMARMQAKFEERLKES